MTSLPLIDHNLAYKGQNKMADILQTTISNAVSFNVYNTSGVIEVQSY